jgi:UDPglucose 6-dehydrogenase
VSCGFVIIGGEPGVRDVVARAYAEVLGQDFKFNFCSARTAEVCKYMENCFLATKVTFVNQFFDIATAFDVDYSELRNLWTLDRRVGNSHTQVTPQRGYGGRCLPKDMQAMIAAMRPFGGAPVLEAIHSYNTELHKRMDEAAAKEKNS